MRLQVMGLTRVPDTIMLDDDAGTDERDLIVTFNREFTDEEMRAFHDYIREWRG